MDKFEMMDYGRFRLTLQLFLTIFEMNTVYYIKVISNEQNSIRVA